MTEIEFSEWNNLAFEEIHNAVRHCKKTSEKGNWQENNITGKILENLPLYGQEVHWSDLNRITKWDAYKLNGKAETDNGDIAIFVTVHLNANESIEGAAYYEAKRQFHNDEGKAIGFKSLGSEQVIRIGNSTQCSNVLLYDIDHEDDYTWASVAPTAFYPPILKQKSGLSMDMRELHNLGRDLSTVLSYNLLGYELDFRPRLVTALKEWIEKHNIPGTVISASTSVRKDIAPLLKPLTWINYKKIDPPPTPNLTPTLPPSSGSGPKQSGGGGMAP